MQPLTRCKNGHYYDARKHQSCPFCGVQNLELDIQKTMAKRSHTPSGEPGVTRPIDRGAQARGERAQDAGRTVGIYKKRIGLTIDPVVGWLVAVKGPHKGSDFRITSEKNFIGRSEGMDIPITDDPSVSRENHATVSFNPKNNVFRLYPGDSKSLVYLNDEEVILPEQLEPYDRIEVGETELLFVPFCGEQFVWKKAEKEEA